MSSTNIPVTESIIGATKINSVSLRSLAEELTTKDFSSWAKAQIKTLGLIEDEDYIVKWTGKDGNLLSDEDIKGRTVRSLASSGAKIDYIVTLENAKHIAMASRTDKGREIRGYFIECEKNLIATSASLGMNLLPTEIKAKEIAAALTKAKAVSDYLNLEGSAKIHIARNIMAKDGLKDEVDVLPEYGIDKPIDSRVDSSFPTESMTDGLKKKKFIGPITGKVVNAARMNKLLVEMGLLEKHTRVDNQGRKKVFYSITRAGLKYGKNVTSFMLQRETQPHWYIHTFDRLIKKVEKHIIAKAKKNGIKKKKK